MGSPKCKETTIFERPTNPEVGDRRSGRLTIGRRSRGCVQRMRSAERTSEVKDAEIIYLNRRLMQQSPMHPKQSKSRAPCHHCVDHMVFSWKAALLSVPVQRGSQL